MNLDLATLKNDEEVVAIMTMSERQIEALGFTEHSKRHSSIVSKWSGEILSSLGKQQDRVRLAEIAGYLHASTVPITHRAGLFSLIKF